MTRSKHEVPEIFSLQEQQKLHQKFRENLRSILYDPDRMLAAVNSRSSITINGYIRQDLTMDELTIALNQLQQNYFELYNINPQIKVNATLLRAGLTPQETWNLPIGEQIIYDASIHYALTPVLSPPPDDSITGTISHIYQKFIANKKISESQYEEAYENLQQSLISISRHAIREHQAFAFNYQKLATFLSDTDIDEQVRDIGYQLLDEINTLAKTPKGYSNPQWLTKVLETCYTAIQNPSIESAIECAELSQQAGNRSIPNAIKNALMTLAGFTLISASILLGVETFGLASPISAVGISMGIAALAGTASASAVVGIFSSGKGANGFFQSIHQSNLSKNLDALSTKIESPSTVSI